MLRQLVFVEAQWAAELKTVDQRVPKLEAALQEERARRQEVERELEQLKVTMEERAAAREAFWREQVLATAPAPTQVLSSTLRRHYDHMAQSATASQEARLLAVLTCLPSTRLTNRWVS